MLCLRLVVLNTLASVTICILASPLGLGPHVDRTGQAPESSKLLPRTLAIASQVAGAKTVDELRDIVKTFKTSFCDSNNPPRYLGPSNLKLFPVQKLKLPRGSGLTPSECNSLPTKTKNHAMVVIGMRISHYSRFPNNKPPINCGEPLEHLIENPKAYPTRYLADQQRGNTQRRKGKGGQTNLEWSYIDNGEFRPKIDISPGNSKAKVQKGATNAQHPQSQPPVKAPPPEPTEVELMGSCFYVIFIPPDDPRRSSPDKNTNSPKPSLKRKAGAMSESGSPSPGRHDMAISSVLNREIIPE